MKKTVKFFGLVASFVILICLFWWAINPLPIKTRILFFLFFTIAFIAISAVTGGEGHEPDRRMMRKVIRKIGGMPTNEHEWDKIYGQAPNRIFFLRKQLKTIHSIAQLDIKLLTATFDTGVTARLQNPPLIEAIKKILASSRISGCDDDMEHLKIQIHTKNKSFSYTASIQTQYKTDVILKFPDCGDYGGIRLPGLKQLLDEKVLNS